jgi:hypothetical protein
MMRRNALRANCKLGQICRPPYFTINLTGIKADFKVDSVRSGHDMKNVVASLKREIQPFVPFRNATEGVPYRA